MRKRVLRGLLAGATGLLALPGQAFAQAQAYTNSPVNLYAGPAEDYPVVSQLPPGAPVTVMGCVSGYTWCDVAAPDLRGWVYAGDLSYPYQGSNVPILTYGTVIGLPVVTFAIGAYWGNYYRGRPWYNNEAHWAHHAPPPPGPPPGRGGPPPVAHGGPPPERGGRPPEHGAPPPGPGNPPPAHVAQPPMHAAQPPMHTAQPPMHVAPPPMHAAPPAERGGPPVVRGAPQQEQHAAPPMAHGAPPQPHGGPPAGHGGAERESGGGGHDNREQHN